MKIHMHLFCLIGALAASVTDGRIASSSSSSSSSSSQPVGGSAVEVTPNRRDLQPALGTHYCTVTDVGNQRGVVDWEGIDQCHKCEGGYSWWPCNDEILRTGFCTPEAVCDERIRAAAEASETPTAAPSDCTAELEEAERLFSLEQESLNATTLMLIDSLRAEKVAVNKENDDFKAQVTTVIAEKVVLEDRVTAINKEKEDLVAQVDKLVEAERLFIQEQESLDATTMMVIESLRAEKGDIIAEKDAEKDAIISEASTIIKSREKQVQDLVATKDASKHVRHC